MINTVNSGWNQGFRRGRIIIPGTARQLGSFGLFRPPPMQERPLAEAQSAPPVKHSAVKHAPVKHAEGGVLWIGLGELLERSLSTADLTELAVKYRTWVLDADIPSVINAASPLSSRFIEVAAVLEQCDVTVFFVSPGPVAWDPKNPLSLLELAESSDEPANEAARGS
jgi:hypothetical protein